MPGQGNPHMNRKSKIALVVFLILVVLVVIGRHILALLPIREPYPTITIAYQLMNYVHVAFEDCRRRSQDPAKYAALEKEEIQDYLQKELTTFVTNPDDYHGEADRDDQVFYLFLPGGIKTRIGLVVCCTGPIKKGSKTFRVFLACRNGQYSIDWYEEDKFSYLIGKTRLTGKHPDLYYFRRRRSRNSDTVGGGKESRGRGSQPQKAKTEKESSPGSEPE